MGPREWIALAALAVVVIVATVRAAVAAGRTMSTSESMRKEIGESLGLVRQTMESVRQLAERAMAEGRAANRRLDEHQDRVNGEIRRLDVDFARLDERTSRWLTTTQKIRGGKDERG